MLVTLIIPAWWDSTWPMPFGGFVSWSKEWVQNSSFFKNATWVSLWYQSSCLQCTVAVQARLLGAIHSKCFFLWWSCPHWNVSELWRILKAQGSEQKKAKWEDSPRCQVAKTYLLFSQGRLQKSWDLGQNYQVWGLWEPGFWRLNLLVSYSLLILGDALGAALPCCGAGEAFPHTVGKTKY